MSDQKFVDSAFLQSTGGACLLHSLTEKMLDLRPIDPTQWLREQVEGRKFYLTPKHLRTLVPVLGDMNRALALDCLLDAAPPAGTFYSCSSASAEGGGSLYGCQDAHIFGQYLGLMEEVADSLSISWSVSELMEAHGELGQRAEILHKQPETTSTSQDPIRYVQCILELALTQIEAKNFVATQRRQAVHAATLVLEEAAAAAVAGDGDKKKGLVKPAEVEAEVEETGNHDEVVPAKVVVSPLHLHLDVVLPFRTEDIWHMSRTIKALHHHISGSLNPLAASTQQAAAAVAGEADGQTSFTDATYHLYLLHQGGSSTSTSAGSADVLPHDVDIVQAMVHRERLVQNISVSGAGMGKVLTRIEQVRKHRKVTHNLGPANESGLTPLHRSCTILVSDSSPRQHAASWVRLALPIFATTDARDAALEALADQPLIAGALAGKDGVQGGGDKIIGRTDEERGSGGGGGRKSKKSKGDPPPSLNSAAVMVPAAEGNIMVCVPTQQWATMSASDRLFYCYHQAMFPIGASAWSSPLLQLLDAGSPATVAMKTELLSAIAFEMAHGNSQEKSPEDSIPPALLSVLYACGKAKRLGMFPVSFQTTPTAVSSLLSQSCASPGSILKASLNVLQMIGLHTVGGGGGGLISPTPGSALTSPTKAEAKKEGADRPLTPAERAQNKAGGVAKKEPDEFWSDISVKVEKLEREGWTGWQSMVAKHRVVLEGLKSSEDCASLYPKL